MGSDGKRLTDSEVKEGILRILLAFDEFSRENGIRYSLGAGTLLGAIRHEGFIPWDDDVDVYVPRPDYDRIVEMAREGWSSGDLRFTGFEVDGFPMPFVKMVDTSVEVVDRATKESIPLHLWIDVFPMDGVPADPAEARALLRRTKVLVYLIKVGNYKFFGAGRTRAKRLAKVLAAPFVILIRLNTWAERRIVAEARSRPYEESEYVCDVVWNAYGPGEAIAREDFERTVRVRFEGHDLPAASGYDGWLRGMYGDYMRLPPKGDRVSHGVVATRVESRGIQEAKNSKE